MKNDRDPFKYLKWCEDHACWFERKLKICPKCKSDFPKYLRGGSEALLNSPRYKQLKRKKLLQWKKK